MIIVCHARLVRNLFNLKSWREKLFQRLDVPMKQTMESVGINSKIMLRKNSETRQNHFSAAGLPILL